MAKRSPAESVCRLCRWISGSLPAGRLYERSPQTQRVWVPCLLRWCGEGRGGDWRLSLYPLKKKKRENRVTAAVPPPPRTTTATYRWKDRQRLPSRAANQRHVQIVAPPIVPNCCCNFVSPGILGPRHHTLQTVLRLPTTMQHDGSGGGYGDGERHAASIM